MLPIRRRRRLRAWGLSVHDGGRIAAASDQVLEEGMVFTVEPGIYVPGWGGVRIEDDVLVTRDGCELLTTAARDLLEVPLPKPVPKKAAKPTKGKPKKTR